MSNFTARAIVLSTTSISAPSYAFTGIGTGSQIYVSLWITFSIWLAVTVFSGYYINLSTGKKRFIPVGLSLPSLIAISLIAIAYLSAIVFKDEEHGIAASFVIHLVLCALAMWKSHKGIVGQMAAKIALPTIMLCFGWILAIYYVDEF